MHCTSLSSVAFRNYSIIPHYLINGTIFGKRNYSTSNVCFDFYAKFGRSISRFKSKLIRYYHKFAYSFINIASYTCHNLLKHAFSGEIFKKMQKKKLSNMKFTENPSNVNHWVQPFFKSKKSPIQSAFYPNFARRKISLLCSQFSRFPLSETHESLSHPPSYFFRIYSTIIPKPQNVLCDLLHYVILARIFNVHLSSDICITSVVHFGLLGFAL